MYTETETNIKQDCLLI